MQLDLPVLQHYFDEHLPLGKLVEATKFAGGQSNPTFLLETESGKYVLRRQPPGKLLKSAHAVDREYRVMRALADTAVPVPKVLHLCTDTDVLGSQFYVMEYIQGDIFWKAALPELNNAQRANAYDVMNQVLAALHSVDVEAAGLADYGKPGNYFERQVGRWTKQYRLSQTRDIPEVESLIDYLQQHIPEDDGQVSIVHGDFRLDNMIFEQGDNDTLSIKAILDWELSTLGHPIADLAYQCMQWRLPSNLPNVSGLGGLDPKALGIPSEQEYVALYCERRGIPPILNWPFYVAFSFFRLLAIVQGVVKRGMEGNASNDRAVKLEAMIKPMAIQANELIKEG